GGATGAAAARSWPQMSLPCTTSQAQSAQRARSLVGCAESDIVRGESRVVGLGLRHCPHPGAAGEAFAKLVPAGTVACMPIVVVDCFSGAGGDMGVGALLDLGLPLEELAGRVGSLGLDGVAVSSERVLRGAVAGTRFVVATPSRPAVLDLGIAPPRRGR